MNNIIILITGIIGLISGLLIFIRPKWVSKLWKIRTAYEIWGAKAASGYYYILGLFIIGISLWLIITSLAGIFLQVK